MGIPRCRFAPYLRGVLEKRVFGYTQLPTQIDFHIPTQVEFARVGIWVYPATHWIYPDTRLYRIPHTHSGRSCASGYFVEFAGVGIWVYPATHLNRICASGYLGILSYPLKPNFVYPLRSRFEGRATHAPPRTSPTSPLFHLTLLLLYPSTLHPPTKPPAF